jgi:hypothetical protein
MSDLLVLVGRALDNMQVPSRSTIPTHILGIFGSLRLGGFLLDLGGRVRCLNGLAPACLGDGLFLRGDHLCANDRATDRELEHIVSAAPRRKGGRVPLSVAVQRRARLPLVIRAVDLEATEPVRAEGLLLLVLDPELWPEPPHQILSATFGLTRREADVAIGVASNRTLAQIAADRGVKVGTVRAPSEADRNRISAR